MRRFDPRKYRKIFHPYCLQVREVPYNKRGKWTRHRPNKYRFSIFHYSRGHEMDDPSWIEFDTPEIALRAGMMWLILQIRAEPSFAANGDSLWR